CSARTRQRDPRWGMFSGRAGGVNPPVLRHTGGFTPPARRGSVLLGSQLLLVLLVGQQVIKGGTGGDLDLDQPALTVGVLRDQRRVVLELRVDLDHLAVNGTVEIIHRLDRFDFAKSALGTDRL